jgi:hypothetical protein
MSQARFPLILVSLVFLALGATQADARGYRGGSGSFSGRGGGSASWSDGSGSASGRWGGSASWSEGSGETRGRNRSTATWGDGSARLRVRVAALRAGVMVLVP